ncbi:MAG: DEAD/DEAH box helicase family protein, partial [Bacteroidetes bacterium]|nr:DEAD/DEAH box helicase family protein [Bacteroidota bacterium]
TFIAFQIVWKLYHTRWNLKRDGSRRPRILFLADRNILADQAFNAFSAFPEDALVRISPREISRKGSVPTNGSIFFTIFQTFMSGASTSSAPAQNSGSEGAEPVEAPAEDIDLQEIDINSIKKSYGYMYILECSNGSFYTGSTKDLMRRIEQHSSSEGAEFTKKHLPVKLVYYENFDRIDEAFYREKQVQSWSSAKKMALIKGEKELLPLLSKNSTFLTNRPLSLSKGTVCDGYFGDYPPDYFDFIIIDECHRGGANDESNWRGIMEHFSPAVQLGLTATPKRQENVDTYRYFGDPVYIYSLKEGINDGFLTPFKVKRIKTTLDEYVYTSDDTIIEGEVEEGKIYKEPDFNKIIEIKAREAKRVELFLQEINQNEKAIVFCSTQDHAMAVRDLVNQFKKSKEPNYCVRVTANDGALGDQYLREFQDNEKSIPTILTTSQKLSTGVDARNIRNIILMRPINTMIEFKQIVGRGTRLFDGKDYFTIIDFVDAYHHFADPEWDGEPIPPEPVEYPLQSDAPVAHEPGDTPNSPDETGEEKPRREKLKIKLRDGKEREIQHMISTSFWSADGKPISAEEFLHNIYGTLPEYFKSEEELRNIWSNPITRKALLEKLSEAGYGTEELKTLQSLISAEKSDLFDVLDYISYAIEPVAREWRVAHAQTRIFLGLDNKQKEFLEFVLSKYIETGVEELDQEKLPSLLNLKYQSISDAADNLGGVNMIREIFIEFQKYLYDVKVA